MKLTPEKVEKILSDAPPEKVFKLHMGTNIKNLRELAEALEIMADRTFEHHVTNEKNDFSNWVNDVIGDHELAEKIKKAKTREEMIGIVRKRVDFLERKPVEHELCKKEFMSCGARDFAIGTLVGFVVGVIIAAVF
ncbi:MAG: DUF5752 family protein [Candidatus Woesearchaeota archaeon]|nr:DUF5752 family protein [Candidatus Woesearchaeota archaeon]